MFIQDVCSIIVELNVKDRWYSCSLYFTDIAFYELSMRLISGLIHVLARILLNLYFITNICIEYVAIHVIELICYKNERFTIFNSKILANCVNQIVGNRLFLIFKIVCTFILLIPL